MDQGRGRRPTVEPVLDAVRVGLERGRVFVREAIAVAFDEDGRPHLYVGRELVAETADQPIDRAERLVAPTRRVQAGEVPDGGLDLVVGRALDLIALDLGSEILEEEGERRLVLGDRPVVTGGNADREVWSELRIEEGLRPVGAARSGCTTLLVGRGELADEGAGRVFGRARVVDRVADALADLAGALTQAEGELARGNTPGAPEHD